jgi:hypothetical protein
VFDPVEFAVLARQLASGRLHAALDGVGTSPECRLRTAVGRAYYALYLSTRSAIARRHGIPERRITHGLLYTCLQYARMSGGLRLLGHELQRLYTLRQKADYEVAASARWDARIGDPKYVDMIAKQAISTARALEKLDFEPVAALLRS